MDQGILRFNVSETSIDIRLESQGVCERLLGEGGMGRGNLRDFRVGVGGEEVCIGFKSNF
jgi:hypothetical protein